jgi:hypothetical protein
VGLWQKVIGAEREDFAISWKKYALEENVNGRNPPRPVEIRCVENGTFRVVD